MYAGGFSGFFLYVCVCVLYVYCTVSIRFRLQIYEKKRQFPTFLSTFCKKSHFFSYFCRRKDIHR